MDCLNPFYVKDQGFYAPCRQCPACKKKRISEWTIRMLDEYSSWKGRACFLTLTYENKYLENYSLDHRDVQLWLKKIRKYTGLRLRYYCAGEYGKKTQRPHYHVVLYGMSPLEYFLLCTVAELSRRDNCVVTEDRYWYKGSVTVGIDACENALRYTAKYINKLQYGQWRDITWHGRRPPYQACSKKLGLSYVEKNASELRESKYVVRGDLKLGLPSVYKKYLGLDVSDYYDEINKKNDEMEQILRDRYKIDRIYETDLTLLDIYSRNPKDAPHHFVWYLTDVKEKDGKISKKSVKIRKKWLTVEANNALISYRRSQAYAIKKKQEINDVEKL